MKRIFDLIRWALSRPRAVFRASRKLGWPVALQLVWMRITGNRTTEYALRIPGYAHPITIRGGQSTDSTALYEVLVYDVYGPAAHLSSPEFIIDGGANIGVASIYFLNRYPTARVLAVEPSPENYDLCRRNLAPYGDRVTLLQGAIWKNPGWLVLESGGQEWNIRVRSSDDQNSSAEQKNGSVKAFTVPELIARGKGVVDLLKLDVEGSELELFGPGADQWLPAVRNIIIELHGPACTGRFLDAMSGYEYRMVGEIDKEIPVVACLGIRPAAEKSFAESQEIPISTALGN